MAFLIFKLACTQRLAVCQLAVKCSCQLLSPARQSWMWFSSLSYLPRFGDHCLPVTPVLWWDSMLCVVLVRTGMTASKLFTCRGWNRRSSSTLLPLALIWAGKVLCVFWVLRYFLLMCKLSFYFLGSVFEAQNLYILMKSSLSFFSFVACLSVS